MQKYKLFESIAVFDRYLKYVTLFVAAAIGSEKPKNGKARFKNPFLYESISFKPITI